MNNELSHSNYVLIYVFAQVEFLLLCLQRQCTAGTSDSKNIDFFRLFWLKFKDYSERIFISSKVLNFFLVIYYSQNGKCPVLFTDTDTAKPEGQ